MIAREKSQVVKDRDGNILGRCVNYPKGWLFLSANQRGRGRVHRDTAIEAIPAKLANCVTLTEA